MRICRTIPPAAAEVHLRNLLHGLVGMVRGKQYLRRVEKELMSYFEVKHVFLLSSGKAALTMILMALKALRPDKCDVLIPAYTCFSVPSAVVKSGLRVTLCDVDPRTFNLDPGVLEKSLSDDTLCVIPNHLFGIPSDMDHIMAVCRKRGVLVIEDAAQAMGGTCRGRKLGTLGDAGFFSLGRGKNITCGSGGIIVTDSAVLAKAIAAEYNALESSGPAETVAQFLQVLMLSLFIHPSLYWLPAGLPALRLGETIFYRDFPIKRLSGMQAGLLYNWQAQLDKSNKTRKRLARWFIEALHLKERDDEIAYLRLPVLAESREARDALLLEAKALGLSTMYPGPVSEIAELKGQFESRMYPHALDVAERILTIPTHRYANAKDREKVVQACHSNGFQSSHFG